jgi:transposase-like protein
MGVKRQYSDTEKAAAMAALMAGQSLNSVAAEYQIPEATLRYWKGRARAIPVDPQKENVIGDLLIDYLEANLKALKSQAEVFTDKAWLSEQGASEAAILHGVMTDKAVRLIEAFSAHDSDTTPAD